MSNNPLVDPNGFMKWKQRMFGFKGKPFDLMNSKLVSNWSGSSDLVTEVTPPLNDLICCESCLKKMATYDGLVVEPMTFALSGKCVFCKRDALYLQAKGVRLFRIRKIRLTLGEIYHYLGNQPRKYAKYEGSRLW